eukprot:scaffold64945_cov55-Phaeocystis_antarctica.AAC.1
MLGVKAELAPKLENRLSLELTRRVQNAENLQIIENVEKVEKVNSGASVALQRHPSTSMEVLTTPETAAQEPQAARATGYSFVLVLELANRNLNTALTHDLVAGNDFPQIRMIMSHLGKALNNLHSKGRIHADFKPLNAARELTWKLIDMDVSRKFGESFDTKLPSSGYCPPEVAKVLLAVHNADTDEAKTRELAKYTASVAYDLWSFGVVLFHLCYGISLFNTDQNDNISLRDLSSLAGWSEATLNRKIEDANKPSTPDFNAAADLIEKLLVSDPEERCKRFKKGCEMSSALKHPFFQVGSKGALSKEEQDQINRIEEHAAAASKNSLKLITMGEEHQSELRRTREVLLKAVFEATEVKTPTAFIILEEKLLDVVSLSVEEEEEKAEGRFNTGMKWVKSIKSFSERVSAAGPVQTFEAMEAEFKKLVSDKVLVDKTMYLYLIDELTLKPVRPVIDELTGKPVKGSIYPIEITTPSKVVPKLLPVMWVGMRAMSLYHGAAGIARMCGAPVPKMPEDSLKVAKTWVSLLKQKSSVEKFGVLHEEVMSVKEAGEQEKQTVRGASLRELQSFLAKEDADKTFAGLCRLGNDDGTAVWTLLTDEKEVQAAIKARAKERLTEQAAQEELVHALLLLDVEKKKTCSACDKCTIF